MLISEELTSVTRALPALTTNERRTLAGRLEDESYDRLALVLGGTRKGASQAAYRARRNSRPHCLEPPDGSALQL